METQAMTVARTVTRAEMTWTRCANLVEGQRFEWGERGEAANVKHAGTVAGVHQAAAGVILMVEVGPQRFVKLLLPGMRVRVARRRRTI